jgi:hypothetical protein
MFLDGDAKPLAVPSFARYLVIGPYRTTLFRLGRGSPVPKSVVFGADDPQYSKGTPDQVAARIGAPHPVIVPGRHLGLAGPLAWLPPALITLIIIVMGAGPQGAVRRASLAGYDNLRRVSAVPAPRERPGDAVLYLPVAYPVAFRRLDDAALRASPVASATLAGSEVSPATLLRRFTQVRRVRVVALAGSSGQVSLRERTMRSASRARAMGIRTLSGLKYMTMRSTCRM